MYIVMHWKVFGGCLHFKLTTCWKNISLGYVTNTIFWTPRRPAVLGHRGILTCVFKSHCLRNNWNTVYNCQTGKREVWHFTPLLEEIRGGDIVCVILDLSIVFLYWVIWWLYILSCYDKSVKMWKLMKYLCESICRSSLMIYWPFNFH